jgi:hypothetical protein
MLTNCLLKRTVYFVDINRVDKFIKTSIDQNLGYSILNLILQSSSGARQSKNEDYRPILIRNALYCKIMLLLLVKFYYYCKVTSVPH